MRRLMLSPVVLVLSFALLLGCLPWTAPRPGWADEPRPIDRLGSQPPLSSARTTPAGRVLNDASRQDLRGKIRRLEFEQRRRGALSPTQRAQQAHPPSPAPIARKRGEAQQELNRLKDLDSP